MGRKDGHKPRGISQRNKKEFQRAWRKNGYGIELTEQERAKLLSISNNIRKWWITRDLNGMLFISSDEPFYNKKLKRFTAANTIYLPSEMIPRLYVGVNPIRVGSIMKEENQIEAI